MPIVPGFRHRVSDSLEHVVLFFARSRRNSALSEYPGSIGVFMEGSDTRVACVDLVCNPPLLLRAMNQLPARFHQTRWIALQLSMHHLTKHTNRTAVWFTVESSTRCHAVRSTSYQLQQSCVGNTAKNVKCSITSLIATRTQTTSKQPNDTMREQLFYADSNEQFKSNRA